MLISTSWTCKRALATAVEEDDADGLNIQRPFWGYLDSPLRVGPRCARLVRAEGLVLHPDSEEEVRQILDRQVTAGLVLKDRLPRKLVLTMSEKAGFLWIPG
jgi:hypothetical protein